MLHVNNLTLQRIIHRERTPISQYPFQAHTSFPDGIAVARLRSALEQTQRIDWMRDSLSVEELRGIYARIAKRYDIQHALTTAKTDQKGRKLLVEFSVSEGDTVLDCRSGTGTTGIMAAKKVDPNGKVIFFDLSEAMLSVARGKVDREKLAERVVFRTGDMVHLPFDDNSFEVVLSTYSLCPLYDPEKGALELYRVTKRVARLPLRVQQNLKTQF